jgi:DNA-binding GntR family transcriptional regulator
MNHLPVTPLDRVSAVDELAGALRRRILDGDLRGGVRLPEAELTAGYLVARHTARAALRALAAEGLVTIEPHRGARVATLDAAAVSGLYELRTALELEATRLALQRHDGALPRSVHAAAAKLAATARRKRPAWSDVVDDHEALHTALVVAGEAPRIAQAHAALAAETRLFLVQLKPAWTLERMAAEHEQLVLDLEQQGPGVLRRHLRESADAVIAELQRANTEAALK